MDDRIPTLQALLQRKAHRLTRADGQAVLALDIDATRPLADLRLSAPAPGGGQAPWSLAGQLMLQILRARGTRRTQTHAQLLRRRFGLDQWFRVEHEACPGVPEAGLAWLLGAISPEDPWAHPLPGLAPTTPAATAARWEAAVTATEALLAGPRPLLGGAAVTALARWWGENLLMTLAQHHMTGVSPRVALDWWARVTTAVTHSSQVEVWQAQNTSRPAIVAATQAWTQASPLADRLEAALLNRIWFTSASSRARSGELTAAARQQTSLLWWGQCRAAGPYLPSNHPLHTALRQVPDADLQQLAQQWDAQVRQDRLANRPPSVPQRPRYRS